MQDTDNIKLQPYLHRENKTYQSIHQKTKSEVNHSNVQYVAYKSANHEAGLLKYYLKRQMIIG